MWSLRDGTSWSPMGRKLSPLICSNESPEKEKCESQHACTAGNAYSAEQPPRIGWRALISPTVIFIQCAHGERRCQEAGESAGWGSLHQLNSIPEGGTKTPPSQHSFAPQMLQKIKQQISLRMRQLAKRHCVTRHCKINPPVKLAISFAAPAFSGFSGSSTISALCLALGEKPGRLP